MEKKVLHRKFLISTHKGGKGIAALSLLLFSLFLFTSCSSAQKKPDSATTTANERGWTVALGVASIRNNLVGKAKDEALLDAKRNAVKKVLGTVIAASTTVKDGEFLSSEVTAKTQGFIEDFEILSATAVSAYEYQVKISAKVNKAKIKKTIEDVLNNMGKPVMLALVQETIENRPNISRQNITGVEIESQFTDKGFTFVDKQTVEKILRREKRKIMEALQGDAGAATSVGWDAKAEIILFGNTEVKNAGKIEGLAMYSMQADVSVRAVDVNTGRILASYQENAAYPHINPRTGSTLAIKRAVKKITKKMIDKIMNDWDPNKAKTVDILVLGLDYNGLKDFRSQLLERVRGVKAVNLKGTEGNFSKLNVEFIGRSYTLLDRILESQLDFNIKVNNSTRPNAFTLQIKSK